MFNRTTVIAVAVAIFTGTLLWAAWVFDPSSTRQNAGQEAEAVFSYELPETNDTSSDVLIHCNEEVMEKPSAEFAKWKGLQGIPMALPGGPMSIARMNDVTISDQFKPAQRATIEVLKRYSPRRVVLIAHTKCLYYDTIAAWNNSLPEVRERQMKDMNASLKLLREWFPQAEISGYMVEEKDRTLFFQPILQPK